MMEIEGTARTAAGNNNLPGVSAAIGGGSGDVNGRQGRALMSKGQEPVQ